MAITAALFDLDGVVVFTDRYHYLSWQALADEQGWAFDEQVNHGCRGVPRMASLKVILDHNKLALPPAEQQRLADRKNTLYMQLLERISFDDVYPGSVELIRQLRRRGVKVGLCSCSRNAQMVLDRLGLADLFDTVVTGDDIDHPKPHPEIFLLASDRLGVAPAECLVFEDARSGVEAAHAAGMRCFGVGPADRLGAAEQTFTDYGTVDVDAVVRWGLIAAPRTPSTGSREGVAG